MSDSTVGEPTRETAVLVAGDWVVDENWVTGIHRSPVSSISPEKHFRALARPELPPEARIENLGGAGRTAAVLHNATFDGRAWFRVVGVGIWHPDDTRALAEMFSPRAAAGHMPYRLTRDVRDIEDLPLLINLGKAFVKNGSVPSECLVTTRLIRIYQHSRARFDLIQRIDWEIPPGDFRFRDAEAPGIPEVSEMPASVSGIILLDLCKGFVCPRLINWLANRFPKAPWFVSSKAWQPKWLYEVPKDNLRLLLIPPVAARNAVLSGEVSDWVGCNPPGQLYAYPDALRAMGDLSEKFNQATIVALPEGLTLLACGAGGSDAGRAGIIHVDPQKSSVSRISPTNVLLAALAGYLLKNSHIELGDLLHSSVSFAAKQIERDSKAIEAVLSLGASPVARKLPGPGASDAPQEAATFGFSDGSHESDGRNLDLLVAALPPESESWQSFDWSAARGEWKRSFDGVGLIEKGKDHKVIELWRATTEVNGFACCVEAKRKMLRILVNELKSFVRNEEKRHEAYLLIAPPGSGKTYLSRCLAETAGLRYLYFNVALMVAKGDILECFDTIVTTQAQSPQEALMVFVDEINDTLGAQFVYDAFLAPIGEGIYVRGGKVFHINPCVWLFAATENPCEAARRLDIGGKAPDFVSRLSCPPLELRVDLTLYQSAQEAQLERVYQVLFMVRKIYPDVHRVSKEVLIAFQSLSLAHSVRELNKYVSTFKDVQYGKITSRNISELLRKDLKKEAPDWQGKQEEDEEEMIEISA